MVPKDEVVMVTLVGHTKVVLVLLMACIFPIQQNEKVHLTIALIFSNLGLLAFVRQSNSSLELQVISIC